MSKAGALTGKMDYFAHKTKSNISQTKTDICRQNGLFDLEYQRLCH